MRTTSLKSTNQGELLNYVSHANKEHYSASLNSLTHSLSLTHTHTSKQASISPGCLRRWRPQPEEDVWSRKGIQKGVFLTLASTEPWTLCFNNPVNTRNRERHTVDGGGRAFPNHFDVPLMSTDYSTAGKRENVYLDILRWGKENGAADWAFVGFVFFGVKGKWGWACARFGSEDIRAGVPAALLLGLPISPSVDVRGLSCRRVGASLEPHRPVVVLMTAWSNTDIQKQINSHLIKE